MALKAGSNRRLGWVSCGLAIGAIAMNVFVFTHPRCWTVAWPDYVPYRLCGVWCVAQLLAVFGTILGVVGLPFTRGRTVLVWLGIATNICVFIGGIVYPVGHVLKQILSQPGGWH